MPQCPSSHFDRRVTSPLSRRSTSRPSLRRSPQARPSWGPSLGQPTPTTRRQARRPAELCRLAPDTSKSPLPSSLFPSPTSQDVTGVNNVKTVLDVHGNALYFSRAMIPHNKKVRPPRSPSAVALACRGSSLTARQAARGYCVCAGRPRQVPHRKAARGCAQSCRRVGFGPSSLRASSVQGKYDPATHYWRKLGIYVYRADFLPLFVVMPESLLQKSEDLEQNKVLRLSETS